MYRCRRRCASSWNSCNSFSEHIFGILVEVQVEYEDKYYARPLPKSGFEEVRQLVKDNRWSNTAKKLCEPSWDAN